MHRLLPLLVVLGCGRAVDTDTPGDTDTDTDAPADTGGTGGTGHRGQDVRCKM